MVSWKAPSKDPNLADRVDHFYITQPSGVAWRLAFLPIEPLIGQPDTCRMQPRSFWHVWTADGILVAITVLPSGRLHIRALIRHSSSYVRDQLARPDWPGASVRFSAHWREEVPGLNRSREGKRERTCQSRKSHCRKGLGSFSFGAGVSCVLFRFGRLAFPRRRNRNDFVVRVGESNSTAHVK